ncbi:MAG TPA: hypothetical protein VI074_13280 [Propionibacteriaceae bacterium]
MEMVASVSLERSAVHLDIGGPDAVRAQQLREVAGLSRRPYQSVQGEPSILWSLSRIASVDNRSRLAAHIAEFPPAADGSLFTALHGL